LSAILLAQLLIQTTSCISSKCITIIINVESMIACLVWYVWCL